jgi:hypothetical protein
MTITNITKTLQTLIINNIITNVSINITIS